MRIPRIDSAGLVLREKVDIARGDVIRPVTSA